jgi:hypothetical protein
VVSGGGRTLPAMSTKPVLILGVVAAACAASVAAGQSRPTPIPQPTAAELRAARLDIPLAPASARVDLRAPAFSHPTRIDNPLFPISALRSAILAGRVDGKDFKTETTLLPDTRIIKWRGGLIETRISQYVAYLDGRIEEVALDHYAQADDGSVWYLGEDVFNYEDGFVADTDGTWFAGREGPPAMIMPAHPEVGDAYRPENIPGLVFEEVRIKAVGRTVDGPRGPVEGAIVAGELHQDGAREDKLFAPGYGEFHTAAGGDVEAIALAVPTDALPGPVPAELRTLARQARAVLRARDWGAAASAVRRSATAWSAFRRRQVPPRLEARMTRALARLASAVRARASTRARLAAISVAQAGLDLELRHRPAAQIDRERFGLWVRRLIVDARARDGAGVRGDLATLEWIRDRFAHTLDKVDVVRIDARLTELRAHVSDGALGAAARVAARLRAALDRV